MECPVDCGDSSCLCASKYSGMRTNGGCVCSPADIRYALHWWRSKASMLEGKKLRWCAWCKKTSNTNIATRWQDVPLWICIPCENLLNPLCIKGTEPCPNCHKPSRLRNEGDVCQCIAFDIHNFVVKETGKKASHWD